MLISVKPAFGHCLVVWCRRAGPAADRRVLRACHNQRGDVGGHAGQVDRAVHAQGAGERAPSLRLLEAGRVRMQPRSTTRGPASGIGADDVLLAHRNRHHT